MSTLFEQASLVMIPSGYKEDVVYSVKPTDGSGDLTFTRASDGTRVNSQGLVERVPWNLVEQSNTFNVTWATSNASVTSGQSGYDGSTNAWLLSKSAANGFLYQTHTFVGVQTISIYAKAGTSNWVNINVGGSTYGGYFDLSNGVTGSSVGSPIATKITNVGGGWYRCEASGTYSGTTSFRIYVADSNGSTSGTSGNIYIQDAQLVEGSTAKPYFPTTDRLNVPRLDYSNGCPSLLLEPQRTNVITNSNDFVTGANNVTTTANNATSPEGYQNADLITGNAGTLTKLVDFNGASAGAYTLSVFAKYNTQQWIQLGAGAIATYANFDIQNGVLGNTNGTSSIEDYGNGWFRCSVVMVSGTPLSHYVGIVTNGTAARLATTASTNSFWAYGIQSEIGSYPTSYIPTTSASVTRVADAAYKTGISSLIGQTAGSFYFEYTFNDVSVSTAQDYIPFAISDGTSSNSIFFNDYNGNLTLIVQTGGVIQTTISYGDLVAGQTFKIAGAYNTNDVAIYINGTQIGTDTSATIPATSKLSLNGFTSVVHIGSVNINQAVLFKTRLTNAELASLTTL